MSRLHPALLGDSSRHARPAFIGGEPTGYAPAMRTLSSAAVIRDVCPRCGRTLIYDFAAAGLHCPADGYRSASAPALTGWRGLWAAIWRVPRWRRPGPASR